MAKLHSDPITETDMLNYLETSDFQLELNVFNSFISHGIRPSHGGIYTDPVTSKDRQYDLRAEIVHGICTLKLAVECKNLKPNFPLLISRVPRMMSESYHEVILGRRNSKPVEGGDVFRPKHNQIFRSRDPVGKSATQVGKDLQEGKITGSQVVSRDSETYDKWSQAIASGHELIEKAGHSSLGGSDTVNATVILPFLIIPNGTLWVADYSSDGQLLKAPYQCEESSLFLEKRVLTGHIRYTISHLLIFTKAGFDAYLGKVANNRSDEWEYLFPENRQFDDYERSGMVARA
jgi:hypothetical protein